MRNLSTAKSLIFDLARLRASKKRLTDALRAAYCSHMRGLARVHLGLALLVAGVFAVPVTAQDQTAAVQYQALSDEQLDDLTARVALYPDAILSEIFVAATYPLEVVAASQWLDAGNNPGNVDQQSWDDSVKGMTRFPAVLKQMAADAAWTNDLGAAFLNQQPDVFASVQRLRAEAVAAGTLYSTPQQQVVQDAGVIQIIPGDPGTIFVPTYSPDTVYVQQDVPVGTEFAPPVTFVYSAPIGPWLAFDCDWDDHRIYVGDWGRDRPWWHWHDHDWHYANFRPGHFTPPARVNWQPREWNHDAKRELPKFRPLPAVRPDRHVPLAKPDGFPEINRGVRAAQDAERGRLERQRQQHTAPPARVAPHETPAPAAPPARVVPHETPVHTAPPAQVAPRETPVRSAPPAQSAPPVREAPRPREPAPAFNDNQRGEDAARDSQRGGQSRGGNETPRQSAPPARSAPAPSAPAGGGGGHGGGRR